MRIRTFDLETILLKIKEKHLEIVEIELGRTEKGVDELVFKYVKGSEIETYHIYDSKVGITPELKRKEKVYRK
jgi:hypothetical protein